MTFSRLPSDLVAAIEDSYGVFFERISRLPRKEVVADLLNENKVHQQLEIFCKASGVSPAELEGKHLLEIGSGYGIFLCVSRRDYNLHSVGIEPSAVGFEGSFDHSMRILGHYGVEPNSVIDAYGENLPFDDNTFDIVFSSMVLEHVENPEKVLDEALRVVKPGGTVQITFPNHHSIFDGHYAVFHPPLIFGTWFFPWLIRRVYRRDPSFAKTIRTELNAVSIKRILRRLHGNHAFAVISLGEEVFLDRMRELNFGGYGGLHRVKSMVALLKNIGLNRVAGRVLLGLGLWSPIILTLRKADQQ